MGLLIFKDPLVLHKSKLWTKNQGLFASMLRLSLSTSLALNYPKRLISKPKGLNFLYSQYTGRMAGGHSNKISNIFG